MRPLVTEWPYAIVYWVVFIWAFAPEFMLNRRARRLQGAQDAGSFRLVMTVQMPAIAVAYAIAFVGRFGVMPWPHLWFVVGLIVMVAGSLLRRHCFRMLGSSFTPVVIVVPGQQVVERGAYRWVRHPSYTAGMLLFAGMTLALGDWLSVAVALTAAVVAYSYRVHVEERALVQILGEPYRAYMRRTKRFIPMVM